MCPICQSEVAPEVLALANLGPNTRHELVACQSCGVRYLSPLPSVEELQNLYSAQYYGNDWYRQQGWGKAFAKIVLGQKTPGKFLDIGCGLGFFIDSIRKQAGWEVYGVEFAASAVAFARDKLGLTVHQGSLSDAQFPASYFDYIQIRNVVEHVGNPMGLLKECRRILKADGVLHLFVPNGRADSLDLINFYRSERRTAFSKSGHLFFFPRQTLLRMFEELDWKVERSRTFGIRKGLASLGYWPRLKDWKAHYVARGDNATGANTGIVLPPKKFRPDIYYTYRLLRMNLRMLPGIRDFGLDYELLLKPKE